MSWFNKLPGFQRTPYGYEVRLLRRIPGYLIAGTLLPVVLSGLARVFFSRGTHAELAQSIQTFDFAMVGVALFVWAAAATLAIACVIVYLMKGPAYVADGYEISDSDKPKSS